MKNHQFIIDQGIDISDIQGEKVVQKNDLLNTMTYVNTLTDCVVNPARINSFNKR